MVRYFTGSGQEHKAHVDGLVQERRNSSALTMQLRISLIISINVVLGLGTWFLQCLQNNPEEDGHIWHHAMETFSALLVLCEGNPPVTGGPPRCKVPVLHNFDVTKSKQLIKQ